MLKPPENIDEAALYACCGSRRWRALMSDGGPYGSLTDLLAAADVAFDALSREDWMQAFAAHSMIGAPRDGDRIGASEQTAMAGADGDLRMALAAANLEYQTRFGFVFLIRARGRSATELLSALRGRLENPPETEFRIATEQQREITALRLEAAIAASVVPAQASEDARAPDGSS